MITAVTGGRDYRLTPADYAWLDQINQELGITYLMHGDCRGADKDCAAWAQRRGIPEMPNPADWFTFGKRAGLLRNQEMANNAHLLLAFPGGRGTAHMIARCKAKGVLIRESPSR